MEPHLLEGDGVSLELSLRLLGKLEALRVARRVALDGAEAAVGAGGRQRLPWLLGSSSRGPLGEVGLGHRRPAVGLGGAEVVGGREVELDGLLGEGRSGRRARGAGGRGASLLEIS